MRALLGSLLQNKAGLKGKVLKEASGERTWARSAAGGLVPALSAVFAAAGERFTGNSGGSGQGDGVERGAFKHSPGAGARSPPGCAQVVKIHPNIDGSSLCCQLLSQRARAGLWQGLKGAIVT